MTSFTSFPPASDPLAALQRINVLKVRQACLTSISTIITALIWTAAVVHVIAQRTPRVWARISPVLASVLRYFADRTDPATAPLFDPISAADIDAMTRDQLFVTLKREVQPVTTPNEWISVGDVLHRDLMAKSKAELMQIAGTKSRQYTKEQLIARIQHGPAQQPAIK